MPTSRLQFRPVIRPGEFRRCRSIATALRELLRRSPEDPGEGGAWPDSLWYSVARWASYYEPGTDATKMHTCYALGSGRVPVEWVDALLPREVTLAQLFSPPALLALAGGSGATVEWNLAVPYDPEN